MTDVTYFVERLKSGTMRYDRKTGRIYQVPEKAGRKSLLPGHKRKNYYIPLCVIDRTTGQEVRAMAHRVIWEHFKGPVPAGLEVHHKNGIKWDNRIENLALVTHSENVIAGYVLHAGERKATKALHEENLDASKFIEDIRIAYKRLRGDRPVVTPRSDRQSRQTQM